MPVNPYVISGTINSGPLEDYDIYSGTISNAGGETINFTLDNGTTTESGISVIFTHTSTSETISTTTNSSGQYTINLSNMTNSWSVGDAFTVKSSNVTAIVDPLDKTHKPAMANKQVIVDKFGDEFTRDYPFPVAVKNSIAIKNSLIDVVYDYVGVIYPDTVTEIYTLKTGGASGMTVATVTLVYSDATKVSLVTATKT